MIAVKDHFMNKDVWPEGDWKNESDYAMWTDSFSGYECRINRSSSYGFLCGYVGVMKEHPLYGKDKQDIDCHIKCHGGVNYTGEGEEKDNHDHFWFKTHDPIWWFGFDCGHPGDIIPRHIIGNDKSHKYRDIPYVKKEVESLARQLKEIENEKTGGE